MSHELGFPSFVAAFEKPPVKPSCKVSLPFMHLSKGTRYSHSWFIEHLPFPTKILQKIESVSLVLISIYCLGQCFTCNLVQYIFKKLNFSLIIYSATHYSRYLIVGISWSLPPNSLGAESIFDISLCTLS